LYEMLRLWMGGVLTRQEENAKVTEAENAMLDVLGSQSFYQRTPWWFRNTKLRYPHINDIHMRVAYWRLLGDGKVEHQPAGWGFRVVR
jgi:hypothetical protein